jgi:hypothetical protein
MARSHNGAQDKYLPCDCGGWKLWHEPPFGEEDTAGNCGEFKPRLVTREAAQPTDSPVEDAQRPQNRI